MKKKKHSLIFLNKRVVPEVSSGPARERKSILCISEIFPVLFCAAEVVPCTFIYPRVT